MEEGRSCQSTYVTNGNNMIMLLVLALITAVSALEPKNENSDEIKRILVEHMNKIPDVEEKYVMNSNMARSIAKYLGGQISVLPFFKVSMKIDRKAVRIPWKLGEIKQHNKKKRNNNPVYRIHKAKHRITTEEPDQKDAETKDAETKDEETKDAETKDEETKDAETKDAETKDAETKDAETKDAEIKDAETKDAETKDVEIKDVEKKEEKQETKSEDIQRKESTTPKTKRHF